MSTCSSLTMPEVRCFETSLRRRSQISGSVQHSDLKVLDKNWQTEGRRLSHEGWNAVLNSRTLSKSVQIELDRLFMPLNLLIILEQRSVGGTSTSLLRLRESSARVLNILQGDLKLRGGMHCCYGRYEAFLHLKRTGLHKLCEPYLVNCFL